MKSINQSFPKSRLFLFLFDREPAEVAFLGCGEPCGGRIRSYGLIEHFRIDQGKGVVRCVVAMPAIHALADGYDVFAVTDASGGVSREAHDMAVRRMVQAGVVPITTTAVVSEWRRDWAREETVGGLGDILLEHGGASGVALAWEWQLLGSAGRSGA